jgi:transposase
VCDLAHQLLAIDDWITDTDREIRETFRLDERAEVIETLPGMGPVLGAKFLAIVGDLSTYADAGRLAAHAGLARSRATPAAGPVTTTGPSATTAACETSSTWPPKPP